MALLLTFSILYIFVIRNFELWKDVNNGKDLYGAGHKLAQDF
jgi:hypothetical protein